MAPADLLEVASSLTRLVGTLHLTKAHASKLKSWAARKGEEIPRAPGDDMATFWRYLHREGHTLLERFDADSVSEHRLQVHRLGCTHCEDVKFNHPESCFDDEAIGLVALAPREVDRQALWPPPEKMSAGDGKHNLKNGTGWQNSYLREAHHAKWAGWRKPQTENSWREDGMNIANSTQS